MNEQTLKTIIQAYFDQGDRPYSEIKVDQITVDFAEFELNLTFKSGSNFCCAEPGCHFSVPAIRQFAKSFGQTMPKNIRVNIKAVIEAGAILQSSGGVSPAYCYQSNIQDTD